MLFPASNGHATYTESGVPVLNITYPVLAFEAEDLGHPSEACQFEHGITRRLTTPLCWRTRCHYSNRHLLSSRTSLVPLVKCLSLANLHQVSPHYGRALGYYVAALCPPCWHSRTPLLVKELSEFPSSLCTCSRDPYLPSLR